MVKLYSIGEKYKEIIINDHLAVVNYYDELKGNQNLCSNYSLLLKAVHSFAFTLCILVDSVDSPDHSMPYLLQMKSSSIHMVESIAQYNYSSYILHQRIIIENLLRFIYYYHHEIEHISVQIDPSKYSKIRFLFEYLHSHPFLKLFKDPTMIKDAIGEIDNYYKSNSKEIHKSTIKEMKIIKSLQEITFPHDNIINEIKNVNKFLANMIFIMYAFKNEDYSSLPFEEKLYLLKKITRKRRRLVNKLI